MATTYVTLPIIRRREVPISCQIMDCKNANCVTCVFNEKGEWVWPF